MASTEQQPQVVLSGDQYARQQLAAEMAELAKNPLDQTVPGGKYAHPDGTLHDAHGEPVEGASGDAAEQSATTAPSGLEGVNFASDEASEAAAAGGLTASDFEGVTASGANGYTSPDVKKLVSAKSA
jgi:hypothetical protein